VLVKQAKQITGGLSTTSKMPGRSYGLPAKECGVGARLVTVIGSTCENCYALKGNYTRYPDVERAAYRRLASLGHPQWVDAMVVLVSRLREPWFRWHDQGDVQSVQHLANICEVARRTPDINHWLPTREYAIVAKYRKLADIPANLVIRLSAHMVDGQPPTAYGLPTSTVVTNGNRTCPAPDQDGECGTCRNCWDINVTNVAYGQH